MPAHPKRNCYAGVGATGWLPLPQGLVNAAADKLAKELPIWMAELMRFTLATGLRESNARELKWAQVDVANGLCWVEAESAKGKRAFGVPLNSDALRIVEGRWPRMA